MTLIDRNADHIKMIDLIYGNSSLNMTPDACSAQANRIAKVLIEAGFNRSELHLARAVRLIVDLLGLERGSSERAMEFVNEFYASTVPSEHRQTGE